MHEEMAHSFLIIFKYVNSFGDIISLWVNDSNDNGREVVQLKEITWQGQKVT